MIARGRLVRYKGEPLSVISPRKRRLRRDVPRRAFRLLSVAFLVLMVAYSTKRVRKICMDVVTGLRYRLSDSTLGGRTEAGPSCKYSDVKRKAVVSYLRTDDYLPLVEQLQCSLKRSNPQLELALMVVDTLSPRTVDVLQNMGLRLIFVDDLQFPNRYEARFRYNWLKIRAFELEDIYDAILLVDADTVFAMDISEIFHIPARFAAVEDQAPLLHREKYLKPSFQGGVLFIRPCKQVAEHMIELLQARPQLQFRLGNAEQEFFTWYFRYEAWILPVQYNTMVDPSLIDGRAIGGHPVKILHFTKDKPKFGKQPSQAGHEYLCSANELANLNHHRAIIK